MKVTPFTAAQFTPTQFDTAEDKAWFANQFVKFIMSGFKPSAFTKRFYNRLSNTFGHIAHYNQRGFWDTFFSSTQGKVDFIEQTLCYPCYGQPGHTYCDVETALQNWLRENNVWANIKEEAAEERTASELALLARLKAKYEPA
jgi:hypothetical protein